MGESTKSLRLLVVGVTWPLEPFLSRLLIGLSRAGVQVTVASARKPPGLPAEWIRIPEWSGPRPLRALRTILALGRAVVRSPVQTKRALGPLRSGFSNRGIRDAGCVAPLVGKMWDVLYFPWNSAAASNMALFRFGRSVVISCRGSQINVAPTNPRRAEEVKGYFEALDRAAVVHCVSADLERTVAARGVERNKIRVIRPGVEPNVFSPGNTDQGSDRAIRVMTTGSLNWKKGHEDLLVAAHQVKHRGVKVSLRIIGDGPDRQRLLFTIRDLGLEEQVELLGRLEESEVIAELRSSDIFLLSSLSEGISNGVLEAMSCGLPVVTTHVGGMAEAIDDGVEGLLVPARTPGKLAEALIRLARDPTLRAEMGRAARERVLRQFTLDRHISAWLDLLGGAKRLGSGASRS